MGDSMTEKKDLIKETPAIAAKIPWWKTKGSKITGIIILTVFVLGIIIWFFAFRPFVSTDDARINASIVQVANAGASGQIQIVNVKEGDVVRKDMILAEIDHRTAQAQFQQAKARADLSELIYNRTLPLMKTSNVSQQQLDSTKSDAVATDANLKLAEIALERTYIRSPVDGVVIQKNTEAGNILETNQVAFVVADIEHAWVSANINEKKVSLVKYGQKVDIKIDEGGSLSGRVADVRLAAASVFALIPSDNASGNYIKVEQRIPVKIELESHPGRALRVGQSVEIRIRVR
jgi:membrane fusion protein, multidrug efflux system